MSWFSLDDEDLEQAREAMNTGRFQITAFLALVLVVVGLVLAVVL